MAYTYSKKKAVLARVLEAFSFVILKGLRLGKEKFDTTQDFKKILIIEPFQMGDVVSLSVMFEPLLKKYARASITILTGEHNENIKEFDERIKLITTAFPWANYKKEVLKIKKWLKLFSDIKKIKKLKFELGIDPRGDIRSQIVLLLTGCQQKIGYTNYLRSNINIRGLLLTRKTGKPFFEHRYDWNLNLLSLIGITDAFPIKFPTIINRTQVIFESNDQNPFIIIHPGGGWKYKRWATGKWVELIKKMLSQHKLKICLLGGEGEREILDEISFTLDKRVVEAKVTNFEELLYNIKAADLYIGLDSGPMNLAVCLNKPVVALFGPGDSEMWRPYNMERSFIHEKEEFWCNPCAQKFCYYPRGNCMSKISVDDVVKIINTLLD